MTTSAAVEEAAAVVTEGEVVEEQAWGDATGTADHHHAPERKTLENPLTVSQSLLSHIKYSRPEVLPRVEFGGLSSPLWLGT